MYPIKILHSDFKTLSREYKGDRVRMKQDEYKIQNFIHENLLTYHTNTKEQHKEILNASNPQIVISETFI